MKLTYKQYLGDSVYAGIDEIGRVWIYTNNGGDNENLICLEEEVIDLLVAYLEKR